MLQAVYQRFAGSCMMLMHSGADEVRFLGTAFLVHGGGYLLTAASCVGDHEELAAVPPTSHGAFTEITMEEVSPIPVEVRRVDRENDVALLRIIPEMGISVPDHIVGNAERIEIGSSLLVLGFSFAHNRLHNLVALEAMLSSKIETPQGTRLLLFDALVQDGDTGGPLVNAHDGRVTGLVRGPFDPVALRREEHHESVSVPASLSCASSIEYGAALLEAEGIPVI